MGRLGMGTANERKLISQTNRPSAIVGRFFASLEAHCSTPRFFPRWHHPAVESIWRQQRQERKKKWERETKMKLVLRRWWEWSCKKNATHSPLPSSYWPKFAFLHRGQATRSGDLFCLAALENSEMKMRLAAGAIRSCTGAASVTSLVNSNSNYRFWHEGTDGIRDEPKAKKKNCSWKANWMKHEQKAHAREWSTNKVSLTFCFFSHLSSFYRLIAEKCITGAASALCCCLPYGVRVILGGMRKARTRSHQTNVIGQFLWEMLSNGCNGLDAMCGVVFFDGIIVVDLPVASSSIWSNVLGGNAGLNRT